MHRIAATILLLALGACDQSAVVGPPRQDSEIAPPPVLEATSILSPGGLGNLRIGMNRAKAIDAMGGVEAGTVPADEGFGSCYFLKPVDTPGVDVMFMNGKVARIDVGPGAKNVITDKNLTLGAAETDVRAAYGPALEVEPHKYLGAPAEYLTWWDRRADQGIRYVTGLDGKVTGIIVGGDAIQLVEGCS